ncbi:hypothetical protein IHV09_22135 [Fictibacillus sp. 23RED33]|uniref:phage tail protein n=1 Tax=Fictibacillus sp. 23RED33 TaxID=2745879 RepID=UPI0018CD9157|nr:hypothetical protein [Fictibacillus sp. 23RED33]MBH0176260.1 hypothetical protein [Fictibacillus sp. 23RED33]
MKTLDSSLLTTKKTTSSLSNQFFNTSGHLNEFGRQTLSTASLASASFRGMSEESARMNQEMRSAFTDMKTGMQNHVQDQIKVQYGYYKMAKGAKDYTGSTGEFIGEIEKLGKTQKAINDQMMKSNDMLKMSYFQTVGSMLARSGQSEKIAANYDRMGNAIYSINKPLLAVTSSLENMARQGNASVLALKMLGPTANMKELNDMVMMINAGLMRFHMVALTAAVGSAIFYGSLHKAASSVPGYSSALEKMGATMREAFQPMVEVFAAVMTKVYSFITVIGEMMVKFNEAHPVLAKVLQGFLMLIPALTLILSPLAIGIGLFAGMQAAMSSVWMLVGPLITGLGAMMGTVFLVAGAISLLAAGFVWLWKNSEQFRTAIQGAWETLKGFGSLISGIVQPAIDNITNAFKYLGQAILEAIEGDFSKLGSIFTTLIPTIITALIGGIPGLIITAARFVPAIAEGITGNAATLSETINSLVTMLIGFITTQLPIFIQQGAQILTTLAQGLAEALPSLVTAVITVITAIVPIITGLLPTILQAGITILQAILDGIISILPALVPVVIQIVDTFINLVKNNLPIFIDAGIKILNSLIQGIIKILPQLITTTIKLITMITDALIKNLPVILNAGMKILTALINGIVSIIPQLTDAIIKIVMKLVDTLIVNLPKIINAGVKILMALIDGIVQVLPLLITAAIQLIIKIAEALIQNLPKIIQAGVKILKALIEGILQIASELLSKIKSSVIDPMIDKFKGVDLVDIGKDIMRGLIDGVSSMAGSLMKKARDIADSVKDTFKGLFDIHSPSRWMRDEIGKNIGLGLIKGLDIMNGPISRATAGLGKNMQMDFSALSFKSLPNMIAPKSFSTPSMGAPNQTAAGFMSGGDIYNIDNITIPAKDITEFKQVTEFFGGLKRAVVTNG